MHQVSYGSDFKDSGQWTSMFASLSTDIGSDLPLWAVQDDHKPGVGTVTAFMGGWTKAYAKQYNLGWSLTRMMVYFSDTSSSS